MNAKPSHHPGEVVLTVGRKDESMLAAAGGAQSPFRLKKILVPVDFSDCSKKALQYALPLARQHGAGLVLLHVAPPPVYTVGEFGTVDSGALEEEMRKRSEQQLAAFEANEVGTGVPCERMLLMGDAAREIVRQAKEAEVDLIVISTHGRTGLKHVLLGSVAEHVVRRASCPVLVVREQEHEFLA